MNSAIVRFDEHAPRLTPEALAGWSRVQAKIAASDTVRLDALQRLGFQLVEGEVDLALPVGSPADAGADVAVEADIAPLREQAAQAFAMSRFRAPWYAADASGRFYAQWIENAVRGTFDHQCLIYRHPEGDIRAFVSLPADHCDRSAYRPAGRTRRRGAVDAGGAVLGRLARTFYTAGGDPDGQHRRA